MDIFGYLFTSWQMFGLFQLLAITGKSAMNVSVYKSSCIAISVISLNIQE